MDNTEMAIVALQQQLLEATSTTEVDLIDRKLEVLRKHYA